MHGNQGERAFSGQMPRYSTDERWLVPNFEKMLYDNALLAYAYLEAFRLSKHPLYRETAIRTLDYVLRELTDRLGGFYCGQDADSDSAEGNYYVFTPAEVNAVLGAQDGALFCTGFDLSEQGNFEGNSIPNLLKNSPLDVPEPRIDALCQTLYDYRFARVRLHKDDKVLTSWNALMISALAKAYRVLVEPHYLAAAQRAHMFLKTNLTDENGRLVVRWRDGDAAHSRIPDGLRALVEDKHLATLVKTAENAQKLCKAVPFTAAYPVPEQGGAYYLCQNGACVQPVYRLDALRNMLTHMGEQK